MLSAASRRVDRLGSGVDGHDRTGDRVSRIGIQLGSNFAFGFHGRRHLFYETVVDVYFQQGVRAHPIQNRVVIIILFSRRGFIGVFGRA